MTVCTRWMADDIPVVIRLLRIARRQEARFVQEDLERVTVELSRRPKLTRRNVIDSRASWQQSGPQARLRLQAGDVIVRTSPGKFNFVVSNVRER